MTWWDRYSARADAGMEAIALALAVVVMLPLWLLGTIRAALTPQALEARRGETGTGSIAEGDDIAVREADAPNTGGTHAQ